MSGNERRQILNSIADVQREGESSNYRLAAGETSERDVN